MGCGPVHNGKQHPITPWHGSWAQQEFAKRCEEPWFSKFHGQWIVRHPDRHDLIVARGIDKGEMKWDGYSVAAGLNART